jgi:hypothetical protein
MTLDLGTTPLPDLRRLLDRRGIRTNAYFEAVWAQVEVALPPRRIEVRVISAAELGSREPVTVAELLALAAPHRLGVCPLEAAIWLALTLEEPPHGGRITVVSPRRLADEFAPRGLYWRHDAEGRWLRGFVATDDWKYEIQERFLLALAGTG